MNNLGRDYEFTATAIPDVLTEFEIVRILCGNDSYSGRQAKELCPLYWRYGDGPAILLEGLRSPFVGCCKHRRWDVEISRGRGIRPLDTGVIPARNPGVMQFIQSNAAGVIRLASNVDLIELIRDLTWTFTRAKILFVVVHDVKGLTKRLLSVPGLFDGRVSDFTHRCMVVSREVFRNQEVANYDLVVVLGDVRGRQLWHGGEFWHVPQRPPQDGPDGRGWGLCHCQARCLCRGRGVRPLPEVMSRIRGRVFAIQQETPPLSPFERGRTAQLFGTHEYCIPFDRKTIRPVNVAWCRLAGGPSGPNDTDPILAKERLIWTNPLTNRRAAKLIRAIMDNDRAELLDICPSLTNLPLQLPTGFNVLVENQIQMRELARELSLPIVPEHDLIGLGMFGCVRSMANLRPEDLQRIDVLIRLDQGVGDLPIPPSSLVMDQQMCRPLTVIDFQHREHAFLRRREQERRSAYIAAGYSEAGQDTDIQNFLRYQSLIGGGG